MSRLGRSSFLAATALAGVVATLVLIASPHGLIVGLRDSPVYLSSAENLVDGVGFVTSFGDPGKPIDFDSSTSPVIDFPIGYPLVLSAGVLLGANSQDWARILGAVLVAAIAGSLYLLALRLGGGTAAGLLVGLVGAALSFRYALAPLSEPLYGLLLLGSLIAAGRFVREGRMAWFIGGSALGALAVGVRTIGIALVVTMAVIGLASPGTRRARLSRIGTAVVLGLVPLLLLFASGGSRTFAWHPPTMVDLKVGANTVAGWFVPPVVTPTVRVLVFLAAFGWVTVWITRTQPRRFATASAMLRRPWMPGFLSALAHIGVLVTSRALFDAQNLPTARLLFPVALSLLIAGVEVYPSVARRQTSKAVRRGLALAAFSALVASSSHSLLAVQDVRRGDLSFRSETFLSSVAIRSLAVVDPGTKIFSNVPDGLWVAGRAGAFATPIQVNPLSTLPNDRLEDELDRMSNEVANSGAVIFYVRGARRYLVDEETLHVVAACVVVDDGRSVVMVAESHPLCSEDVPGPN